MQHAGQRLVSKRIDAAAKRERNRKPTARPAHSKVARLALMARQLKVKQAVNLLLNPSLPGVTVEQQEEAKEFLKKYSPSDLVTIRKALLKS